MKKKTKLTEKINGLVRQIEVLPGQKIVTLVSPTSMNPLIQMDVSHEGAWGYELGHAMIFLAKLATAVRNEGGMTIRQFLPDTFRARNGQTLPRKRIYAVKLGKGMIIRLPAGAAELASTTDARTGRRTEPEEGVEFAALDQAE